MSEHSHGGLSAGARHIRPLLIAFGLTATYMVVEFVVGFSINSLALVSDAAHMGTDVLGLGMALAAISFAQRAATRQRTYGLYRLEVLAALANGILLFGVSGYVICEAIQRFAEPPEVPGLPLLITAVVGLAINLISFRLLSQGSKESLNLKGASLEVLGDLIGSVGVILAAIIIFTTGWPYADAVIGIGIGLFILPRTFQLTRQALRILIEAAPKHINVDEVQEKLLAIPGVATVHDLHVWTITSGMESASGHVVIEENADFSAVLQQVQRLLREDYHIEHSTIQCEPASHDDSNDMAI
jgi:cobalt-zinc-cadmium efflux system protein